MVVGALIPTIIRPNEGPRECYVPRCDLFSRPNNQVEISLLAKDALARAGINTMEPFTLVGSPDSPYWLFVQE